MTHNEDTRVKIPALIHLTRLGYSYLPRLEQQKSHTDTNIFEDIFISSISKLNPNATQNDIIRQLEDLKLQLDYDDLGQAFYSSLINPSGLKLIDLDNFANNNLYCTTELTCKNGEDEFRPDITVLVNGLPLIFIEVKKPNNQEGIIAERKRMSNRFKNSKFRKFLNAIQLMVYSNNMEYDNGALIPLQGAYYATTIHPKKGSNINDDLEIKFNYFREEESLDYKKIIKEIDEETENLILKDNNLITLKHSPEFITNKKIDTPTNRLLTSLLSKERLAFILKYALVYVERDDGIEKHIMRYPQMFATKSIAKKLATGVKKGVIWHTQGSGKTALAYYNVKYLTDYYQRQNIIARFFFIVDRLDLLKQAQIEFASRGISVNTVNSKEEFIQLMNKVTSTYKASGKLEITIVNIQKFSEDATVCNSINYNINLQNIYFLDEVHRSYSPSGSFLANLLNSDRNAVLIGLTGTPLLVKVAKSYSTTKLFGDYIHTYYYNQSVADGYTLRLIREEISTEYKICLREALEKIEVEKGSIKKEDIYSHKNFISPMLDYITEDLIQFRKRTNTKVGGMVICASSKQAKVLFTEFESRYGIQIIDPNLEQDLPDKNQLMIAESKTQHIVLDQGKELKAALILHDVNNKDIRNKQIKAFKSGFYDLIFVFNMLLTGFDAPILKKLYFARVIENHNLLQALTRVNRPYKDFRYGYVVDFADISAEFKKTNEDYFRELEKVYGEDCIKDLSNIFKSEQEIERDIEYIKKTLFLYETENKEIFSQQISEIKDKSKLLEIVKALHLARDLYNIIRTNYPSSQLIAKLDFSNLHSLYIEAQNRLNLLNKIELLNSSDMTTNLINEALEDIVFDFKKLSEAELILADKFRNQVRKTRHVMLGNFDHKDPEFITLKEEFEHIFRQRKLSEMNQQDINENIKLMQKLHDKVKEINRKNNLIKTKYNGDEKYARIYKRLVEKPQFTQDQLKIMNALIAVKQQTDDQVLHNRYILDNEDYFIDGVYPIVIEQFTEKQKMPLNSEAVQSINNLITKEYLAEYKGISHYGRY